MKFNYIKLVQVFLEAGIFRNFQICELLAAVTPLAKIGAEHIARHGLSETSRTRDTHKTFFRVDQTVNLCNEHWLVHIDGRVQTSLEIRVIRINV